MHPFLKIKQNWSNRKRNKDRSISPPFPALGPNTQKIFGPNAGKCGPESPKYGHFLRSVYF